MVTKEVTILNATGLHARPAQKFVEKANEFTSSIFLVKNDKEINAKSILGLMTLGLSKGSTVTIKTDGEDEELAITALAQLIESKFGEE